MAGDQLQKSFDVDLTQLDAKLKQEEVLWRSIDERSDQLEKKLIRQQHTVRQMESRARSLDMSAESGRGLLGGQGTRLAKRFTGNAIASGLSNAVGIVGSLGGRLGNMSADAIFSAGNMARGGIYGAVLWGINEMINRIQEEKERREKLEDMVTTYYERLREEQQRLKFQLEDEERARKEREDLLDIKASGEAAELIYQSSQFLDQ